MMYGKFTENETGRIVDVQSVFQWGDCPMMVIVTYPEFGKQYGVTVAEFELHFTMCAPQELQARAFGAVDERPTETQMQLSVARRKAEENGDSRSPD